MHTVQVVSFGSSFVTPSKYKVQLDGHLSSCFISLATHLDYITVSLPTVTIGAATAAAAQLNETYNNCPRVHRVLRQFHGRRIACLYFRDPEYRTWDLVQGIRRRTLSTFYLCAQLRGACDCGSTSLSLMHFGVFTNVQYSTLPFRCRSEIPPRASQPSSSTDLGSSNSDVRTLLELRISAYCHLTPCYPQGQDDGI